MPEFNYTLPQEIDGSPDEVEGKALDQLIELADLFEGLTDRTCVQVRNAYHTRVLNEAPDTPPATLAAEWEASDAKAAINRVQRLARASRRALESA